MTAGRGAHVCARAVCAQGQHERMGLGDVVPTNCLIALRCRKSGLAKCWPWPSLAASALLAWLGTARKFIIGAAGSGND